jgi:hypothetical protein
MTAVLATLTQNNYGLRVFCDACKRVAEVDVKAAAERCGTAITLPEIGRRARCKDCGGLGGSVQVVAVRW